MGVCLVASIILGQKGCMKEPSKWIEKEEKKDGLNIYQYVDNVDDTYKDINTIYFKCPICNEYLSGQSNTEIINLKKKGPKEIIRLKERYYHLVYSYTVDIFNELEEIKNKIEEYGSHYDENRFYKYKCEKKNRECYLIIYQYNKEDFFRRIENKSVIKDQRYEVSQWKNDENIKNALIKERQIEYEEFQRKEKIRLFKEKVKKAREEAKKEWEEITFQREYEIYLDVVKYINIEVNHSLFDGNDLSLSALAQRCWHRFKYTGGLRKMIDYIAQFAKDDSSRNYFLARIKPQMSKEELIEYQAFEKPRIPVMKIIIDPTVPKKMKK